MENISELVKLSIDGNEEAFKELFEMSHRTIYYKVNKIVMDEASTMDILQNTYIKAHNNLSKLDEPKAFLKWLNVIATNETKDYLKKRKDINLSALDSEDGALEFEIEDESLEYRPDSQADIEETKEIINNIIYKLPETQRAVIMMFYFDELKITEIATILEISENTVKSRLRYAKDSIEKDVRNLEKNDGIRLYGFTPLAFFVWHLKETAQTQAIPPLSTATAAVLEATTQTATKSVITQLLKPTTTLGKVITTTLVSGSLMITGVVAVQAINYFQDKPSIEEVPEVGDLSEVEDIPQVEETPQDKPVVEEKPNETAKPPVYVPTEQEKKAIEAANAIYDEREAGPYWIITKRFVVSDLKEKGFTEKEANYGTNNSKFDWNAELVRTAHYFQSAAPKSHKGLVKDLLKVHPEKDALYAANNAGIDWKKQPFTYVKWHQKYDDFSRYTMVNFLKNHGEFTNEEIEDVKKNHKVNWNAEATRFATYKLTYMDVDKLEEEMLLHQYTPEEILYVKKKLGI